MMRVSDILIKPADVLNTHCEIEGLITRDPLSGEWLILPEENSLEISAIHKNIKPHYDFGKIMEKLEKAIRVYEINSNFPDKRIRVRGELSIYNNDLILNDIDDVIICVRGNEFTYYRGNRKLEFKEINVLNMQSHLMSEIMENLDLYTDKMLRIEGVITAEQEDSSLLRYYHLVSSHEALDDEKSNAMGIEHVKILDRLVPMIYGRRGPHPFEEEIEITGYLHQSDCQLYKACLKQVTHILKREYLGGIQQFIVG